MKNVELINSKISKYIGESSDYNTWFILDKKNRHIITFFNGEVFPNTTEPFKIKISSKIIKQVR